MIKTWHVAIAEMRRCRRMLRTWLLIALSSSVCISLWVSLTQSYVRDSPNSPIVGVEGPRYLIVEMAQPLVVLFAIAIIFLAFDVRSRDVRDRMSEVVDIRPVTNFELLVGRLLGTTLPLLVPAVLTVGAILVYGLLAPVVGWEMGAVVEPVSVLSFLTWDIVPNLVLWGTLTMLLAVILRSRVVVAFTAMGIMTFYLMLHEAMPLYLNTGLSTYSGTAYLASDIAPQFISWDILINRAGVLLLASSFLLLAACLYPRLINPVARPLWIGAGLSGFLIGVLTLGGLGYSKYLDLQRVAHWTAIHKEHQTHQQTDIESIRGSVEIRPGSKITLNLNLVMAPTSEELSDDWLFSLNPGYRIDHIAVDEEVLVADDYSFKDGILRIQTAKKMDSGGTIHLRAHGVPNPLFAYLDSALDWKTMESTQARRIALLGRRSYVFHPRFVALLSGVSWFPTAGAAYGRHVLETHKRDFFDLDLEVSIPDDWIVAGPGTRQRVDAPRTRFRFNPSQPVPEFALIASKFERRSFETRGIEFELLLSPKHTENLAALESVAPVLQTWVENQIDWLKAGGLSYPLGTLSFVEVPTHLRVYGGGWNMGSVYAPPGIHMIRESGFPIAQFERVRADAEEHYLDNAERVRNYLFEYLKYYFQNDLHGGSPMMNLGEQLLGYQAVPHGKGATALHTFVNELAGNLALDGVGMFSIYFILDGGVVLHITADPNDWFARNFITMTRGGQIHRARVWEPALRTALSDLNFETQPKIAFDVILLKSHAVSWTVRELVPPIKISAFLGKLITEHRGQTYSPEDFFNIARDMDIDFNMLVGDWLHSTDLPGFLLREPHPVVELVPTESEGVFEYQTSFVLRNNESAPGAVGIEYELVGQRVGSYEGFWADTIHVPGNTTLRVALRTPRSIQHLTLHPHLALNRDELSDWRDDPFSTTPHGSPLPYTEEYDWNPSEDDSSIIVDDLSEGFAIVNGREHDLPPDRPSFFAYFFGPDLFKPKLNHGLPSLRNAQSFASRGEFSLWFRETEDTSHGKYFRTYTSNPMGTKEAQPQFATKLPSAGHWRLEFHVPATRERFYPLPQESTFVGFGPSYSLDRRALGKHIFEINAGDTTELMELDLSGARSGWHELGIFETSSQEVRVTLVEVTDGVAIADAIRWTPVER